MIWWLGVAVLALAVLGYAALVVVALSYLPPEDGEPRERR